MPLDEGENRGSTGHLEAPASPTSFTKGPFQSRRRSSVLKSSLLEFKNVEFRTTAGAAWKDRMLCKTSLQKTLLSNVSGTVHHGRVLAVLGPSGAGKTTLINILTLDAFYGAPRGSVTLNGVPMTGNIFREHCYVCKQQDKHWPYLTARESLQYAAGLLGIAASENNIPVLVVEELLAKLGLQLCADTNCNRLSGGERRRLSIATALLKRPTLLFFDEPTSGLDAAAASSIMQEISRVAKEENLIVVCTIHQPSTRLYEGFDQVMILSRGRLAYSGTARGSNEEDRMSITDSENPDMETGLGGAGSGDGAAEYFASLGFPLPKATNPAEHFLDLVNSDFSGEEAVDSILDAWEKKEQQDDNTDLGNGWKVHPKGLAENHLKRTSLRREIGIMFRRHLMLVLRDPILYLGRCAVFLVMNCIFAIVYWNARNNVLDQVFNKTWINLWFSAVPAQMGIVAVYVLNDECKSIERETQNGMSRASIYVLAKTLLVIPIFVLFGLFGLIIPSFIIQATPWSSFGLVLLLYAAQMFVYESAAEVLSIVFEEPIMGMLAFIGFWFFGFLFGGILIPVADLYWPFKVFFYITPNGYFLRSIMYTVFTESEWEGGVTSTDALSVLHGVYKVIDTENRVWQDIFTLLALGTVWKVVHVALAIAKTGKVATIQPLEKRGEDKTVTEKSNTSHEGLPVLCGQKELRLGVKVSTEVEV